jgi:biotin carboxyl carrier protein
MIVTSDLEAIGRVVAAFERSDWAEIDVRSGGLRVHLIAGVPNAASAGRPAPVTALATTPATPAPVASVQGVEATASTDALPPGAHLVVSPSPGICWRSPEPGTPHFVDLGDVIDESATVCIVEVMKLMSHLKAGVSGRVVAVYGENGVAVEKGQPLFAIAPSGSAS